jgi:hypothetical protein
MRHHRINTGPLSEIRFSKWSDDGQTNGRLQERRKSQHVNFYQDPGASGDVRYQHLHHGRIIDPAQ